MNSVSSNAVFQKIKSKYIKFSFNNIAGITIALRDNTQPEVWRMGNVAVFNICFALNGTFLGTTGWQPIFDVPNGLLENGETIQFPYFLSGKTAQNESYDLLEGRSAYLTNGQQLAMSWIQYQIVGVIY